MPGRSLYLGQGVPLQLHFVGAEWHEGPAGAGEYGFGGCVLSKFGRNYGMCILFVVVGAILGGILGELIRGMDAMQGLVPYLVHTYPVFDMEPATINLYVIKLTIGFSFAPKLMSILGIVLAVFLFRRY